ncbi:MAG: LPXTG cell wall anchor domain-containing protein [Subdoligranulum sp.]|nr:LPXTG cell wall anchor domain-containing protein [Subdoligranulum sp.]
MQKTNFKTRLLALLTAVFMVVMCMPFAAFAASTDPATRQKIVVNFAKDGETQSVTLEENAIAPTAPQAKGGKWSNGTNGAPDLAGGETLLWSQMNRYAAGDYDNVAYISYEFKADEKEPEPVEKTVNINLNTDNNKGTFVGYDGSETISFENLPEIGDPIALPKVKANDGYKFTGWKVEGAGEAGHLDANATEFGYTGLAHFPKDSNVGYITLTAQFEEDKTEQPEETKKTIEIYLNTDNTKGVFVGYDGAETISFKNLPEIGDPIALPKVKANDGYKFTGWKVEGAGDAGYLDANATEFGYTGVAHFPKDSNVGYITLTAQFEEDKTEQPEETKKTVSVTITTNNEQGIFPDYDGQEVIHFDNLDPNTDQQFELPKVEAKPGYEFIGWHVNGNEVGAWDADAKTFGITGLAHFEKGSNVGYLTIAAVYKAKTERTVEVTFSVDPDKGEFEKNDLYTSPAANVKKLTATEFDGTQYAIPTVKAKAGYKFVGWKGQGADVIAWNADAKTFGVTGLCFFNGDDATTGYATVEAVFEKVEDKKNDNSSSSSSASSSSNKTTTASNEKQVVKAAAAPANTTKVLPKTGASNVAPLLGGSLAVVALLMGYGVYSLVLRKKD